MERFEPTSRTKLHRLPARGAFDKKALYGILDAGFVAHVGFVDGGQPFVLPLIYGRSGNTLYLHGSAAGRHLRALASGTPICVTVTLLDGLVIARAMFHHSMNYRCAVILGQAKPVTSPASKANALKVISDHMLPGRWEEARGPNQSELKQTLVVELPLAECSAKIRTGEPKDDAADYSLPIWAGVVPMSLSYDVPAPDPKLLANTPLPKSLVRFLGPSKRPRSS